MVTSDTPDTAVPPVRPDLGPAPLDARLSGVLGGRTATAIEKAFGYRTVGEFLEHAPRRYAERGALTALDSLAIGESVTIVAEVIDVRERTMRARRGSILEAKIGDGKGLLTLTFFNQGWRTKDLVPGARGIFAGKVGDYRGAGSSPTRTTSCSTVTTPARPPTPRTRKPSAGRGSRSRSTRPRRR